MPIITEGTPLTSDRYPRVQFVAAPEVGAAIRLDFNALGAWADEDVWPGHEGFSIGAPSLEGDPDGVGVEWGFRELSFALVIRSTKSSALHVQSTFAREIMRRENWLMFQLNESSAPVWFKTYRTQPGELSFEHVYTERNVDVWGIGVSLIADPFAYGERVTLPAVTITNDPVAATNPCFAKLPTIVGDAPAPAHLRLSYSNTQDGRRHMLAASPAPADYSAPIVWDIGTGDRWTIDVDAKAPTADAAYSGGSYRHVDFATNAGMARRLFATGQSVRPGRYKVLVRASRNDTGSQFEVQFGARDGSQYRYGPTVAVTWGASTNIGHAAWVDLGEFAFPYGNPLATQPGEPTVTQSVALGAARTSGGGNLRLDSLIFVPVNDERSRVMFVDYPTDGPLTNMYVHYDGDMDAIYNRGATDTSAITMSPPPIEGEFPLLVPGENNILHFLEQTSPTRAKAGVAAAPDCPDRIATTVTLLASYHPRWLWIGAE